MALLYLAGGLTTLLILVLPHPRTLHFGVMTVIGATSPPMALAIQLLRHRLPIAAYPWLLAVGTVIVTVLVGTAGSTSAFVSFSFFYTWIALYSVLFFAPAVVAVQIAAVGLAYGSVVPWVGQLGLDSITAFEPVVLVSILGTTSAIIVILSRAREVSEIDPLTQVPNRRGLHRVLDSAMRDAPRASGSLNVAMIDVDHFKSINDQHGHGAGDRVLEELTQLWRTLLRPGDCLGRIGGDEFLVVLPGCSRAEAEAILERLRIAAPKDVTCSLGGAPWQPGDSASMLMSNADAALYQAKRLGRNRVAWAVAR